MSDGRRVAIVMTTIFDPEALDVYASNIAKFGHDSDGQVIVIGDRKVDPGILSRIENINRRYGDVVDWWGYERQVEWIKTHAPDLLNDIPANSDNRRNVGYLVALSRGADVVVSVDDDNFPLDDSDFVGDHALVGKHYDGPVIDTGGWFNMMSLLESDPDIPMWPRGFPYKHRSGAVQDSSSSTRQGLTIGLNAGLWLGDPDIDAITRIAIHPDVKRMRSDETILKNTFTPINSQNTSVAAALLPAYYYFRMHESLYSWKVNRFGDIWQGLVVEAVAYHLEYGLRIGTPAVRQLRNEHDLLIDLRQELPGILVNEWLADLIAGFRFSGQDAGSAVIELHDHILEEVQHQPQFPADVGDYFASVARTAERWVNTCRILAT